MTTPIPKVAEIQHKWFVVDAEGKVLGRLAVKIADIIRGKNKPTYTPHLDTGDYVVVINAEKVVLTGKKETDKIYQRYSGYMGGLKEQTAAEVRAKSPERLIEDAVWGMLPKGRLGRAVFKKLTAHAGPANQHEAQKCEKLEL